VSREHDLLQIGEVAERVGLSLRTVRYYEEVGLVSPAARSDGGFRLYSEDDVQRLLLAKRMKPMGLTLDEMRELLEVLERSAHPEGLDLPDLRAVVAGLESYGERGDERIAQLERELAEAHKLRLRISERLGRCDAVLGRLGHELVVDDRA
jgi:MerR family transcriptional regulator, copper efflux regulator